MAELKTQILIRNDTAENWTAKDPVLGAGEFGVEVGASDNKLKIGDGEKKWSELPYTYNYSELQQIAQFDSDLQLTMQFGRYKPGSSGSVVVPAEGKTAQQVLLDAFAVPTNPTVGARTLTISTSGNQTGEVGELFALPTATAKVGTGSYQYGSYGADGTTKYTDTGTGIVFSSISISSENPAKTATGSNSNSDVTLSLTTTELPDADRKFTDTARTFNFSASASHDGSPRTPVNNVGTKVESLKIGAQDLTATGSLTVTGYRKWFMYIGKDHTTPISSAFIRGATHMGWGKDAASQAGVEIPAGTTRIVVAIPTACNKALTEVIDVDGMGLSAFGKFVSDTVEVEGANGATAVEYKTWTLVQAEGLAATHYDFTIG